jgi:hypothetical protein
MRRKSLMLPPRLDWQAHDPICRSDKAFKSVHGGASHYATDPS